MFQTPRYRAFAVRALLGLPYIWWSLTPIQNTCKGALLEKKLTKVTAHDGIIQCNVHRFCVGVHVGLQELNTPCAASTVNGCHGS